MKIKRLNELFDDPDMRDRLEVPHLKGDLDMDSGNWKDYLIGKDNKDINLLQNVLYNYPIINAFHKKEQVIDKTKMYSFWGSTKEDLDEEYYGQLSIAFHEGEYYANTIFRLLEDLDPKNFVINEYNFDDIELFYTVIDAFLKTCDKLGILDKKDLEKNTVKLN
jgi:hypothetical protein